jgi:hypothetical protein
MIADLDLWPVPEIVAVPDSDSPSAVPLIVDEMADFDDFEEDDFDDFDDEFDDDFEEELEDEYDFDDDGFLEEGFDGGGGDLDECEFEGEYEDSQTEDEEPGAAEEEEDFEDEE